MGKTKLETSVAEIIGLPTNEFTFYRIKGTRKYHLYVHHKHFDYWVSCFTVERELYNLGNFLLENQKKKKEFDCEEKTYIKIYLKGQWKAIYLYKYDYNHNFFVDDQFDISQAQISYCMWKNFQ